MSFNEEEWDNKTQQEVDRLLKEEGTGKAYSYELRREMDKQIIKDLLVAIDEFTQAHPTGTAEEFEELILNKIKDN